MINPTPHLLSAQNNKPVLVFIHYFGGAAQSWKWVIPFLSPDYYCIALTLPGFGATPMEHEPSVAYYARFIQEELERLGVMKYSLIGHSMGGKIALQVALNEQHQKKLRQLILLAPSPPTIERMPESEKERMLQHPNEEVEKETVHKVTVVPLKEEEFALAVHTQSIIDNRVWRWWILEGMNTPLSSQTTQLTLPIALMASVDDPSITPKMLNDDVIPNLPSSTQLMIYKKIGHLYPLEAPEWLAGVIRSTIKN
ncbi:MAG: hypothetical protein JWM14_636 [Chitinophagaceae bacterium]|nr:hypothetical protein [Chitinophagaceae bacterium]